jgi:8-oxo-dGTP pyrophosphatase MutT (NUDIX family)
MRLRDELVRRRLQPVPDRWDETPLRRAAVLAPIFAQDDEDWLLFTVRPPDLRQHGGQISFPGGMQEGTESPQQCALREAAEEIGVDPAAVRLLGSLPTRQSSSRIAVHCLVGRIAAGAPLRIDRREVERVLAIPWRELVDRRRWREHAPPPAPDGRRLPASPHFACGPDVVWGLTGRFAFDLVQALDVPGQPGEAPDAPTDEGPARPGDQK